MRRAVVVFILVSVALIPLAAQGRRNGSQGIPPGHLPRAGECRVWYDNRPPGRQPAPTNCRDAERIASRDRSARVIYGDTRRGDDGWWDDDRRDRGPVIRGRSGGRYPDRYPYPNRYPTGARGYSRIAFENGYEDGYDKGREDADDRDAYDPVRHGRYRSGDRGYESEYGSKDEYKNVYREGFRAGYADGYRAVRAYAGDRRDGGIQLPWPF